MSLHHWVIAPIAAWTLLLAGCARHDYFATHPPVSVSAAPPPQPSFDSPRGCAAYVARGSDAGMRIDWQQVIHAVQWSQVAIIGEQHDDAVGHAVQRAIVEDVTARCPGRCCALAMEMFERDEQAEVDDFLDGLIDANALAKQTFSENWGGQGKWHEWYQPIVDAAKANGAQVIAANAPRRYVRLARTHGYERLKQLPRERRSLFDFPVKADDAAYRQRFMEFLSEGAHDAVMPATTAPATTAPTSQPSSLDVDSQPSSVTPLSLSLWERAGVRASNNSEQPPPAPAPATAPAATMPAAHASGPVSPARFNAAFGSQSLWDATMAASIVEARRHRGAKRIIHLVGQFHSDFEGGTVAQLKARWPGVKLLVISLQRDNPASLRVEDIGRADVVIYTGAPDDREEPDSEE